MFDAQASWLPVAESGTEEAALQRLEPSLANQSSSRRPEPESRKLRIAIIVLTVIGCLSSAILLVVFVGAYPISFLYLGGKVFSASPALAVAYSFVAAALLIGGFASVASTTIGGISMFLAGMLALPVIDMMFPLVVPLLVCGGILAIYRHQLRQVPDTRKLDGA